jgi:hypothetical protein
VVGGVGVSVRHARVAQGAVLAALAALVDVEGEFDISQLPPHIVLVSVDEQRKYVLNSLLAARDKERWK